MGIMAGLISRAGRTLAGRSQRRCTVEHACDSGTLMHEKKLSSVPARAHPLPETGAPRISWLSCLSTANTASAGTDPIAAPAVCKGKLVQHCWRDLVHIPCRATAGGSRTERRGCCKALASRRPARLHCPAGVAYSGDSGAG